MPATSTSLTLAPSGAPIAFTSASATGADHATRFFSPNSPFSGEGGSSVRSSSPASMPAPASAKPGLAQRLLRVRGGLDRRTDGCTERVAQLPGRSSRGVEHRREQLFDHARRVAAGEAAAGASSAGSGAVPFPVPKSASVISLLAVPSAMQ